MVDAAPLAMPGTVEQVVVGGVTLSLAPPAWRWSLRASDADGLAGATGLTLPRRIGETVAGVAMLGPDEWYAVLAKDRVLPDGAGAPVSIVDVSSRAVGVVIEGKGALGLLTAGCPLDLARWPVGRSSRTVFETVEIILWREAERRWRVEVWRSFAPWLWAALTGGVYTKLP